MIDDEHDRHRVKLAALGAARALTQWPLIAVLVVVGVGGVVAWTGHWRWASAIIGCGVAMAALLRLILPERVAGLLVVRSRWVDVTLTGAMALGILALTLVVPAMRPS